MPVIVDPNLIFHFKTPEEFRMWLEKNQTKTEGIWLKLFRKDSKIPSITHDQALDVALCFGWIDGVAKKLDDPLSWVQKFTPRRKHSLWSKRNIEITKRLIDQGLMTPHGQQEIDRAKQDGRWQKAYDSPSTITLPEDFLNELQKDARAYQFFQTLNKTNTYAIGWRLQTAKTKETYEKRKKLILEMLKNNKKFH